MEYTTLDFSRFETRFLRFIGPQAEERGGEEEEERLQTQEEERLKTQEEERLQKHEEKLPDDQEDELLCFEIEIGLLHKPPKYTALSYCWGDPSNQSEVEISGKIVKISTNLESALRHARLAVGDLIWADAICINQNDLYEKSYQVNMMGQIYANAERVIAWLGMESPQSSLAARLLELMVQNSIEYSSIPNGLGNYAVRRSSDHFLESLAVNPDPPRALQGLTDILTRPYWERVWVIQEISKARAVYVRCGKLEMNLQAIIDAAIRCPNLSDRSKSLIAAISKFREREMQKERMCLIDALLTSRFSLATDARDKVYALLGLARDSADLVPIPTYAEPVHDIFEQLTKKIMENRQPSNVMILAQRAPLCHRFRGSSS